MNLVCRTCMQINKNHINILEYCESSETLSDMLLECTTIQIEENDGLPLYICNSCLKKLTSAWDFRVMVIKTDSKLRNIFNKHIKEHTVPSSKKKQNVNKKAEEPTSINFDINDSENFILHKNKNNIEKRLDNVNKYNLNQFVNNSICKNNKILKTYVEQAIASKKGERESEYVETKNINNIVAKACIKEKTISIEKVKTESEYAETKNRTLLINNVTQNILNSVHNSDANILESNNIITKKDNIEKPTNMLNDVCIKNTSVTNEDEAISEISNASNDQDNAVEADNEVDNLNENMMEVELYSQERLSKLTSIEKQQMFIFCKICNRAFRYKYYFNMHVRLHNGDRHKKCDICGKTFVCLFQLQLHMAVHSKLKPFSCQICGKKFKTKNCLYNHKNVHLVDTPFSCIICQKTFKTKYLLRNHFERHKNEKKYTCEICGKSFSDPSSIYVHKYTHADVKNIPCPTCGKLYANDLSLRRHMRLHGEERPYQCKYCNKSFKRKSCRDEHTSIHTGKKPLSCKICTKSFRHSASLYNHMRIHKREAPYACEICPSQFKYSRHLQNHMKLHE